jgi:polyamine oxidase
MKNPNKNLTRRGILSMALGVSAAALAACSSQSDPETSGLESDPAADPATPGEAGNQVAGASLVGVLRTSWRGDPWARGSYSFMSKQSSPQDRVALREPLAERLVFAGEATHSDFPATVHGALLSGIDAAEFVVEADAQRVIVIGAGACGLAAAAAIAEEGIEVIVVEARDRIGGRVWTNSDLGFPVDLGGSWIHGVKKNPLTKMAADVGADLHAFDYDDVDLQWLGDDEDAFYEVVEIEQEYAADVDDLGRKAEKEGDEFGGGDALLPGGYLPLFQGIADSLDVRTSQPVRQVAWSGDGVTVSLDGETLSADAVIVTVPLGVLKADAIAFDPPLPAAHQQAIDRLGMGLLDKLVLQFDKPFWPEDVALLGIIPEVRGEWTTWVNLLPLTGQPALMGFSAGSVAERFSALSEDDLVASALRTLRAAYE